MKTITKPLTLNEFKAVNKAIRTDILTILHEAGSGHPGGSLSMVEMLSTLFFNVIKRTPENALSPDRDRLILSKGHGIPAVYAIFKQIGMITDSELHTFRQLDSRLQGHPDRVLFPEVEASTGSLGQGLSIAQGIALAARIDKKDFQTYCILGDGEMQEGQIWEAIMSAGHYKLDNLCVILDNNKGQIDGYIKDVMDINPLEEKLNAFKWNVIPVDGHDCKALLEAYEAANAHKGAPSFIIADTVKGKGVSFMENQIGWHGKAPNKDELQQAIQEIQNA